MIAFGVLDDAALWLLRDVTASTYWQQWLLAACGIVIVGIGVAFQVAISASDAAAARAPVRQDGVVVGSARVR